MSKDRETGFDLSQAPIMRFNLLLLSEDFFQFSWSCHHVLLDGWSGSLIIKEVFDLYSTLLAGIKPQPNQAKSYGEYVSWLQNQDFTAARKYWKKTLEGFAISPSIKPRILNYNLLKGKWLQKEELNLGSELTLKLEKSTQHNRYTLSTFFMGVWAVVSGHFSQQQDLVIGSSVSGRQNDLPEIDAMTGLFANVLPFRVKTKSSASVNAWLQDIQNRHADMRQYEYATLSQILQWCDLPAHIQLFESILLFENYPWLENKIENGNSIQIKDFRGAITTNSPLTLLIKPRQEFSIEILYEKNQFSKNSIQTLMEAIQFVLAEFLSKPNWPLSDVMDSLRIDKRFGLDKIRKNSECTQNSKESPSQLISEKSTTLGPAESPQNDIERQLIAIWENVLKAGPIGTNHKFFDIGGNSTNALSMFIEIEKKFGLQLPVVSIFERPTIKELAKLLDNKETAAQWKTLIPLQSSGAKPPLFMVPNHAATVLEFRHLPKYLGKDQPIYGIQHLGFGGEADPHHSLVDMAKFYIKEIESFYPQGPYLLAGRCFGCKVVYEIAQQMLAAGKSVSLLAIIDAGAPRTQAPQYVPPPKKSIYHYLRRGFHHLWQGKLKKTVNHKIKAVTSGLNSRQERFHQRVYEAQRTADQGYVARPYPGKITLIFSDYSHSRKEYQVDRQNWEKLAMGGLDYYTVPGDVFTLFDEPSARGLAKQLELCIANATN